VKGNIPAARLLEPRALQRLITAWQESGASDESASALVVPWHICGVAWFVCPA